ncbi:MAG: hotdog domain-containing protein [Desulfohalobiaceae bacterium]
MQSKTVAASSMQMCRVMRTHHANRYGFVHGGHILRLMDSSAGLTGIRHCRCKVVTACVRGVDFQAQAHVGELLWLLASLNDAGRTSMEIGVRVEAEQLYSADVRHVASGYFCCVALDEKDSPQIVPGLIVQSNQEKRRRQKAKMRKQADLELGKGPEA